MGLPVPRPRTSTGQRIGLLLIVSLAAVLVPAAVAPPSYAAVTARGTTLALAAPAAGAPAPLPRPAAPPVPLDPRALEGWWMDGKVPTWLGPDGKIMALWWGDSWWCGGWRVDGRTVRTWGRYWSPGGGPDREVTHWVVYPDGEGLRRLRRPFGEVMPLIPAAVWTLPVMPPTTEE